MVEKFEPRRLGRTGFNVYPIGIGADYGIGADGVEEAFERGVNYFYWAWKRKNSMGEGLRRICKNHRDKVFIVITSFVPGPGIRWSVERARKALDIDYIDGLQFYLMKNRPPGGWSQLGPALKLKEEGLIRHISATGHHRPNFANFARKEFCDLFQVRYNAVHRGAETEVFPNLPPKDDPQRPGVAAFTVTCWGKLLKAKPEKIGGLAVPTAGDCYRFALSNPAIDLCYSGPANTDQMRHALDAVEKGPMSDEELQWMRDVGERLYKK